MDVNTYGSQAGVNLRYGSLSGFSELDAGALNVEGSCGPRSPRRNDPHHRHHREVGVPCRV